MVGRLLAMVAALVLFASAARGRGKAFAFLEVPGLVAQLVWAAGHVPGMVQAPYAPYSALSSWTRCSPAGKGS